MMATRSPIVCLALLNIIRTLTEHNAQHESHRGAAHTSIGGALEQKGRNC